MQNRQDISHNLSDDLQFLIACCQVEQSDLELYPKGTSSAFCLTANSDTPVVKTKEGCIDTDFILNYLSDKDEEQYHNLISLSASHGILPLVYKTIKEISTQNESTIPSMFLSELKAHYMGISQRNMLMSAELIRIMKLLKENDIEALAFKGPALSQMAYGDITLRQYSDLDIYVDKKDIAQVAHILEEDKYDSRVELKFFENDAFLNVNSDVQFYRENNSMLIEIHWTVFRSTFSSSMKKLNLWKDTEKVRIQNYELSTFKTETLLLYLCMHGSKHIWGRIEWITDIDRLIRSSEHIDWDEVYRLARIADGVTMLELGLFLSSQLFNTPLNEKILKNLNGNEKSLHLAHNVLALLDQKKALPDTELKKNYKHFRFHLSLRDTMQSKFDFLLKTLFPLKSSDVELVNLPKSLFFLYYLLRPFRLIGKYIQKIFSKN